MGEMGDWEAGSRGSAARAAMIPASPTRTPRSSSKIPSSIRAAKPRVPLTRETVPQKADSLGEPEVSGALVELWDSTARRARDHAARMRALAPFWLDRDAPGADSWEGEVEDAQVAVALRCTTAVAYRRIRDAHIAITQFPRLFERLEAGEIPAEWMDRVISKTSQLPDEDRLVVDGAIDEWDLRILADVFNRALTRLVAWLLSRHSLREEARSEAQRRVEILEPGLDGTACLQIIGPAPEICSLGRRLDAAARAVQAAQRRAREEGRPMPCHPDSPADGTPEAAAPLAVVSIGTGSGAPAAPALSTGLAGADADEPRPMTLAQLRYALLTTSVLETDGVDVPNDRFRINVTVPAMTLLGASDAPGTLDGITPIPADMARSLAGGEHVWYRVLTDPASGAFLPLPADRYAPTRAMREHLRLRNPVCAVPGCTRPTSAASEADHIIEYDHHAPASGGQTDIENLHLLCWQHHLDKTAGRLDPIRLSSAAGRQPTPAIQWVPDAAPSRGPRSDGLAAPPPLPSTASPGIPGPPAETREPGTTRWQIGPDSTVDSVDEVDLVTPAVADELRRAWEAHLAGEDRRERYRERESCRAVAPCTESDVEEKPAIDWLKRLREKQEEERQRQLAEREERPAEQQQRSTEAGHDGGFHPSYGPPPF